MDHTIKTAAILMIALSLSGCGGGGNGDSSGIGDLPTIPTNPFDPLPQEPTGPLDMLAPTVMEKVTWDSAVYRPDVAISDAGKALAVWAEDINGKIRVIAVEGDAAMNSWGDKIILDDAAGKVAAQGEVRKPVHVVMGADGRAVVAWSESDSEGRPAIKAVSYAPSSGFDTPQEIASASEFTLVGNRAGGAMILWLEEYAPGRRDLLVREKGSGEAAWSVMAENLTAGGITGDYIQSLYGNIHAAMNDQGQAIITATAYIDNERRLIGLSRDANGDWSELLPLLNASQTADTSRARVAISPNGNAVVTWIHRGEDANTVQGVTVDQRQKVGEVLEYVETAGSLIELQVTYRSDGSLFIAAAENVNHLEGLLYVVELRGSTVAGEVYQLGGQRLVVAGAGNRVSALARNGCRSVGVRDSAAFGEAMSSASCGTGTVTENLAMAVTPGRAGVFAAVGRKSDPSHIRSSHVIELSYFD